MHVGWWFLLGAVASGGMTFVLFVWDQRTYYSEPWDEWLVLGQIMGFFGALFLLGAAFGAGVA